MSRAHQYRYRLGQKARKKLILEQAAASASVLYRSYMQRYEKLKEQEALAYLPEEMERLNRDLERIHTLLSDDARAARELCNTVGAYIYTLPALVRAAQTQFTQAASLRAEAKYYAFVEQKNRSVNIYYQQIQALSPQLAGIAAEKLKKFRDELEQGKALNEEQIRQRIAEICAEAQLQEQERNRDVRKESQREVMRERLAEAEHLLSAMNWEDKEKEHVLADRVVQLNRQLEEGRIDLTEVEHALVNLEREAEEEQVSEAVRRQTVIAIMKQLHEQEFMVSHPELIEEGGESYVKIVAQQPSGRRALCRVDLKGTLQYRFDKYEGMACLKDIQQFHVDLERIYSVNLSDERVLWENPDRLLRREDNIPVEGEKGEIYGGGGI